MNADDYGKSENGNFFIGEDPIGVPHPYCITPKHIAVASDQFSGMLGKDAIMAAERQGASCGVKGCLLNYEEHEQVLAVMCQEDASKEPFTSEAKTWLESINEKVEADGYVGYTFVDCFSKKEKAGG